MYVQYGCGLSAPEGWHNFDGSPRLRLERNALAGPLLKIAVRPLFPPAVRYGDIVSGLPIADGGVHGLYASHVLEHLYRDDMVPALSNSLRILRPGGIFRLIVPDLAWRAQRYLARVTMQDWAAADDLMQSTLLGQQAAPTGLGGRMRAAYGNSDHRWMYDFDGLARLLVDAGFVSIRRCVMNDSGDPMFDSVEDRDRFFEGDEPELAIQCARPTV